MVYVYADALRDRFFRKVGLPGRLEMIRGWGPHESAIFQRLSPSFLRMKSRERTADCQEAAGACRDPVQPPESVR